VLCAEREAELQMSKRDLRYLHLWSFGEGFGVDGHLDICLSIMMMKL
jgi:hypothetical protein